MDKPKCLTCEHCGFWEGNGNPSRWYCYHRKSPSIANGLAGFTTISKGERHDKCNNMPRKKEPRWCPLKGGK